MISSTLSSFGFCMICASSITQRHQMQIDIREASTITPKDLSKSLALLFFASNPSFGGLKHRKHLAIGAAHHSARAKRLPSASQRITSLEMVLNSETNDEEGKTGNLLLSNLKTFSMDGAARLILASQSPRRREILDMMGLSERYAVIPSPLDEEKLQKELAASPTPIPPRDYARKLAESKAYALGEVLSSVADSKLRSTFILGSDTIVDLDGQILEKPRDEENAKAMLTRLSGCWHEVHTGVALYRLDHQLESEQALVLELVSSLTDTANVKFTSLSPDDIDAYVGTGEPMDKAGSYGIQGMGGQIVERIEGDFFTVMGLPMHLVSKEMAKALSQAGFT